MKPKLGKCAKYSPKCGKVEVQYDLYLSLNALNYLPLPKAHAAIRVYLLFQMLFCSPASQVICF